MRTFNSYEKEILKFMVTRHSLQDVCTINLFDKFCDATLIEWSEDFSKLHIYAKEDNCDKNIREKIFNLVILLQYLETEKYIGIFGANLLNDNRIYNHDKYEISNLFSNDYHDIWEKDNHVNLSIKLKDSTITKGNYSCKYLIRHKIIVEKSDIGKTIQYYANSTFYPTQTLIDFVNNNFQTEEDKRYNKSNKQAWIAIFVSIVIGLLSIDERLIPHDCSIKQIIQCVGSLFSRIVYIGLLALIIYVCYKGCLKIVDWYNHK